MFSYSKVNFYFKASFSKNGKSSSQYTLLSFLPQPTSSFTPFHDPIIKIYHCILGHLKYQGKSTYVNISEILSPLTSVVLKHWNKQSDPKQTMLDLPVWVTALCKAD